MLDNLTYTKSIEYNKGNYTNSGLDGIDKLLKNGLSTIEQCSGINYHGVSLGVTKVYATEYSESTKDQRKGRVRHLGYPEDSIVQLYVNYAYWVSGGDVDFLATLDAENGRRVSHRQSEVPDVKGPNGKEDSYGFCMLHRNRHSNIVDDPRFRSDPRRQISQCRFKYNGGTRFYGYDVRHKSKKRFKVIRPIGQ